MTRRHERAGTSGSSTRPASSSRAPVTACRSSRSPREDSVTTAVIWRPNRATTFCRQSGDGAGGAPLAGRRPPVLRLAHAPNSSSSWTPRRASRYRPWPRSGRAVDRLASRQDDSPASPGTWTTGAAGSRWWTTGGRSSVIRRADEGSRGWMEVANDPSVAPLDAAGAPFLSPDPRSDNTVCHSIRLAVFRVR